MTRGRVGTAGGGSTGLRAQSETIGLVLLLGMTVVSTGAILVVGATVLDDSRQASQVGGAEQAMAEFDNNVALVALGGSDHYRTQLPAGGSATVRADEDAGWMRVDVYNYNASDGSTTYDYTLMNETLGAVVYENGRTSIAYQGGGVWQQSPGGTTMVSPPEFHYRGTTLTLPLITVEGNGSLSGTISVESGATTPQYPVTANASRSNPLSGAVLNVTVHSRYYRAWGAFFSERTGGIVTYDHPNRTVMLRVKTPSQREAVSSAVASTSTGTMVISGSGGSSFTDSYNSSLGPYANTSSENGTIETAGGVDMAGGAEIRGNLVSGGGTVDLDGSSTRVTGNVSYAGSFSQGSATVEGWTASNGTASAVPPVGTLIDDKKADIKADNDNANTSAIDNSTDELTGCSSNCTLTAGRYYLDDIALSSGETLVLDLSSGDVVVAVENGIDLSGGNINVTNPGGGQALVYVDGNTIDVTNGANVSVPGDAASNLWIFGPPDTTVTMKNSGTRFTGAIYAPESEGQSGTVNINSDAQVFGAVVGGQTTLKSGGTIHYDLALRSDHPLSSSNVVRVTYLHVSVNAVTVSDE